MRRQWEVIEVPAEQDRRAAGAGKSKRELECSNRVMLIRIMGNDQGEPYGDIVHANLKRPVPYHSLADLSFSIDKIARFLNLLKGREEVRSLGGRAGEEMTALPERYQNRILADQGSREKLYREIEPRRAEKTVCLELIGGNHMSLQGRLWGEITEGRYRYFRSVLELMYLFSEMQQAERRSSQDRKETMNKSRQNRREAMAGEVIR